ncbi:MAG: hypothetical protein ABR505_11465, partial [Actinomycetota bacterium]
MPRRRRNMQRLLPVLLIALLGCESGSHPPVGLPEGGPARFEFLSSWEPSLEEHGYVTVIDYSFVLRNSGVRAATPTCEVRLGGQSLPGWSQGPEVGVGDDVRVTGEALVPEDVKPNKILPRLEPRCHAADGREVWTGVPRRFFAMEGDQAYFAMTR